MKTLKNKSISIVIVLLLISCTNSAVNTKEDWKTIEIGNYLFDFPSDFKLVEEKGIDSYVGRVVGDSMWFGFDYGYYSNKLEPSTQDYLKNGEWRKVLPFQFLKDGITYNKSNLPKVEVMNIRPANSQDSSNGMCCDFVAKCKYDSIGFDFPISIPEEILQLNFKEDTIDNQYIKIVYSKVPQNGTTGIYVKDLSRFNNSMNSFLALSMATGNLTLKQQKIALEIFKTIRRKKK